MRRLAVVHKEVGGGLISHNLQLACIRKLEDQTVSQCLTNVGIELLWQLKIATKPKKNYKTTLSCGLYSYVSLYLILMK